MDLAARDSYIQKLASKVINQQNQEPKKRPFVPFKGQKAGGPPQQKKKSKPKSSKDEDTGTPAKKSSPAPARNGHMKMKTTRTAEQGVNVKATFSSFDVLRKRLHEKIEEAKVQGAPKETLSEAAQAKKAKRKLERERKKRKKKEFRLKKLAEAKAKGKGQSQQAEVKQEADERRKAAPAGAGKRRESAIIFNTVETVQEEYADKALKKKAKRQRVKGQITPLSGRNYKQLLSRLEARKDKLDKLRQTDQAKAREVEDRMKWTNALYKAEGVKIKDDEDMLRAALANKEKKRDRRKKHWDLRSQVLVEKMQKRQDKRTLNIQKRKNAKIEKKKTKARKKGRVLAEDLQNASL